MKIHLSGYEGKNRIVSLALDETTQKELLSENVSNIMVFNDSITLYPDDILISKDEDAIKKLKCCNNFDVFELYDDGDLTRLYDDKSGDALFFITEKCNSNCIICPSPEASRKRGLSVSVDTMIDVARHIPSDTPHITITGGEPFLVGKDLFRLLEFCRDKFEGTEFLILTNGRVFALKDYCSLLYDSIPNHCIVAIPLHGSYKELHDAITRTPGSFEQTIIGLKRLQSLGIKIEIRIVVNNRNVDDLEAIARLIIASFDKVSYVSIMAMEMTGGAFTNSKDVWIPYSKTIPFVRKCIDILMKSGTDVRLYNYPLCLVDTDLRTLCFKSISEWKRKYADCCSECSLKDSCGGLFGGTFRLEKEELKAI